MTSNAQELYLAGIKFEEGGFVEQAIHCLTRSLAIDPCNAQVHFRLGGIYYSLNQHELALQNYENALSAKPDFLEAYNNRGTVLLRLGHFDRAIESYDNAIRLNSQYVDAYNNRGTALLELGRSEEALQNYRSALCLQPNKLDAISNLAVALNRLGHYDAALAYCNQYLGICPQCAAMLLFRGQVFMKLNQFRNAITSFHESIRLNEDPAAYFNMGNAYAQMGLVDQAIASHKKALHLDPHYIASNVNLALLNLKAGNFIEGWEWFENQQRPDPVTLGPRKFSQPRWLGQGSLKNKTILLFSM